MKPRVYKGTRRQKCNIRLVAFIWTMLGAAALMAILDPLPNAFFQKAFNHSDIAISIFVIIALGRGLIGLMNPKRYWLWFRVGSFNVNHNTVRGWSWVVATSAWIACASLTAFSLPDWLIVWGVVSFVWLILPYIVYADPKTLQETINADDERRINPATGLPMTGGVDTRGNPYGMGDLK